MSEFSEQSVLFVPGGGSYLEDGSLKLSLRSARRANVAAATFNSNVHEKAIFAGGYPGLTQGWGEEDQVPPDDEREAYLMAEILEARLQATPSLSNRLDELVLKEGDSTHSIGDAITSIERGFLSPEEFNQKPDKTLQLVTGALHGKRFRMIFSKALDIDPARITRAPMLDHSAEPERPTYPRQYALPATAKEIAATAITGLVLRNVEPGNLDSMKEAEARFMSIAQRLTH